MQLLNEIELTVKKNIPNIFLIQLLTILLLTGCANQLSTDQHTSVTSNASSGNFLSELIQNSAIAQLPQGALSRAAMMGAGSDRPYGDFLPQAITQITQEREAEFKRQQLMLEQQKFQRQIEEEALQRNLLANFLEDKDKHAAANLVRAGVPLTTAIMFEE